MLEEVIYEVYLALFLLWGCVSLEDGGNTDGRRVFPEGSLHDETGCLCPSLKGDAVSIGIGEENDSMVTQCPELVGLHLTESSSG